MCKFSEMFENEVNAAIAAEDASAREHVEGIAGFPVPTSEPVRLGTVVTTEDGVTGPVALVLELDEAELIVYQLFGALPERVRDRVEALEDGQIIEVVSASVAAKLEAPAAAGAEPVTLSDM